jgi:hypothetical protein
MTDKHPYIAAPGYLVKVINQFRKSFPSNVDASTLQKLGLAPKNESSILNILRFLNLIDKEGNKTEKGKVLLLDDVEFAKQFAELVKEAYTDLFNIYGEDTWKLDTKKLITFFRKSDDTTENVGQCQASTFLRLAGFSGHGEIPSSKSNTSKPLDKKVGKKRDKIEYSTHSNVDTQKNGQIETAPKHNDFGLTVRIEINLPADGDQATYDRIFKSIKENLLNG